MYQEVCAACQASEVDAWSDYTVVDEEGREVLASTLAQRYMRWRPRSWDAHVNGRRSSRMPKVES